MLRPGTLRWEMRSPDGSGAPHPFPPSLPACIQHTNTPHTHPRTSASMEIAQTKRQFSYLLIYDFLFFPLSRYCDFRRGISKSVTKAVFVSIRASRARCCCQSHMGKRVGSCSPPGLARDGWTDGRSSGWALRADIHLPSDSRAGEVQRREEMIPNFPA